MRHRKDAICNLQISDDPVFAQGVHFTYNIKLSHKKHFYAKLGSLKKTLSVWSRRDLSIYGRINIVKTLTLSKLVFISSVMETPKNSVRFYLEGKTRQNKKDNPHQEEIGWRSWHERFCSIR